MTRFFAYILLLALLPSPAFSDAVAPVAAAPAPAFRWKGRPIISFAARTVGTLLPGIGKRVVEAVHGNRPVREATSSMNTSFLSMGGIEDNARAVEQPGESVFSDSRVSQGPRRPLLLIPKTILPVHGE